MKRLLLWLAVTMVSVLTYATAQAAPWPPGPPNCGWTLVGRCMNVGYFSGLTPWPANGDEDVLPSIYNYVDPATGAPGTYAFPGPLDPTYGTGNGMPAGVAATHFINFLSYNLNAPNPGGCAITNPNPAADYAANNGGNPNAGCWKWRRQVLGASFIILTMVSGRFTTYPGSAGPPPTGPRFIFKNTDTTGVANAKAQFAAWAVLVRQADQAGDVNWDKLVAEPAGHTDSSSQDYGHDDAVFSNDLAQLNSSIVFSSSGGSYVINRSCANTNGFYNPLPVILNYHYVPGIAIQPGDPPPGTLANPTILNIVTNPTLSFTASGKNIGAGNGPTATIQALNTKPALVAPASFTWNPARINAGATASYGYTQTINPGTPDNTVLCFYVAISPVTSTNAGPVSSNQFCYKIEHPRYPAIRASSGDIHAGNGLCTAPGPNANVKGYPSAASDGQYVVSATGAINDFTSNNNSPDSLKIGKTGGYAQVCRPDLVAAATTYQAAGKPYKPIAGAMSLNGASGVYINTGGDLHITGGTVASLVTIVKLGGGDIYIDNNVGLTGAASAARSAPSLGIISDTNIFIDQGVHTLDAYLFANGIIDTCRQNNITCNSTLTVNGFLMAHAVYLHRMGPLNSDGQQTGEQINLNPQIYLNPPTLFDASTIDGTLTEGQGEEQPLY